MDLESLLELRRTIRVIGFDDAPFSRGAADRNSSLSESPNLVSSSMEGGGRVAIAGVVCARVAQNHQLMLQYTNEAILYKKESRIDLIRGRGGMVDATDLDN